MTRRSRAATSTAQDYSADTRLASFGAITARHDGRQPLWTAGTCRLARRLLPAGSRLAIFGTGSPGIQTFSARWFQVNLTKNF